MSKQEKPIHIKNQPESIDLMRILYNARSTGIGIEALSRLDATLRQYSIEFITPKQLAMLYGCGLRNMHRMLYKLESAGYVSEVRRETQWGAGRPGRVLKIDLGI